MKKFFNNKTHIFIFSLIAIILLLIIIILFLVLNKNISNSKIDASNMSYDELVKMFENQKYIFELTNLDGYLYISLINLDKGITIQRIPDTLVGTLMSFHDEKINDEFADILYISENDTKEKETQYEAYENWLKYYNISELQLCNLLDNYYEQNMDKVEYVDTSTLFN